MLVNPYADKALMATFTGTRILREDFGLRGVTIEDKEGGRLWRVESVYAPLSCRVLGGIRLKVVDDKNFVSFLTQMDAEVLLGVARPGDKCRWSGKIYQSPGYADWFGFCADSDDLDDDLLDRELLLRAESQTGRLPDFLEMHRRVHLDVGKDVTEFLVLSNDTANPSISDVDERWQRFEQVSTPWEHL